MIILSSLPGALGCPGAVGADLAVAAAGGRGGEASPLLLLLEMGDDVLPEEADRVHDAVVRRPSGLEEEQDLIHPRRFVHLDRLDAVVRVADAKGAVID